MAGSCLSLGHEEWAGGLLSVRQTPPLHTVRGGAQ
jgi:hypothetical protein